MRSILLTVSLVTALALSGCGTIGTAKTAKEAATGLSQNLFAPPTYIDDDYWIESQKADNYGTTGMTVKGKSVVYRYLSKINENYESYISHLTNGRAATNIAFDSTNLALTGSAAISTVSTVKTGLAALSTFFQGTKQSIDKNLFDDQATFALISVMEVRRTDVLKAIRTKLLRQDYAFGDAMLDLDEYYRAGTLQSALQASFLNQASPTPEPAGNTGAADKGNAGATGAASGGKTGADGKGIPGKAGTSQTVEPGTARVLTIKPPPQQTLRYPASTSPN